MKNDIKNDNKFYSDVNENLLLMESIENVLKTFTSIKDILQNTREVIEISNINDELLRKNEIIRKNYVLDSLKSNNLQRQFKDWELKQKKLILNNEIFDYNRVLSKTQKINFDIYELYDKYEHLLKNIVYPNLSFSKKTLFDHCDESQLKEIFKNEDFNQLSEIPIEKIFNIKYQKSLNFLNFTFFQNLLNLEFKLRIKKRIKYEIFVMIKKYLVLSNHNCSYKINNLTDFIDSTNSKLQSFFINVEKMEKENTNFLNSKNFESKI